MGAGKARGSFGVAPVPRPSSGGGRTTKRVGGPCCTVWLLHTLLCWPPDRKNGNAPDALFPGCLVTVRLVGVLQAEQTEHGKTFRNDRLLGAIETPVNRPAIQTFDDLRPEHLDEIEYFFMTYNHLEGRHFKPIGRHGPALAAQLLADGIRQFDHARGGRTVEQHTAENHHRR